MESVKTYSVEEVIAAECTLEPMECKFCHSHEVVFLQYVGDAYCQECGSWQLDEEVWRGNREGVKLGILL